LRAHAELRAQSCHGLESERLVFRYAFGSVEARFRGQDLLGGPVSVLPPEYHPVKDVSHAVVLAALLFLDESPARKERVAAAIRAMDAALAQLDDGASPTTRLIPPELLTAQKRILRASRDALTAFSNGQLEEAGQRKFLAAIRPDLESNLRIISGAFVRELDRRVTQVRKAVEAQDPSAWQSLLVVIGVAHQARAREIGVQYFERLLNEPVGEGARNERQMVIAESAWSPTDQFGLLATHLVDQEAGDLIFDDSMRLQFDVLANDGGALDAVLPKR
jgi:hypothetical protein